MSVEKGVPFGFPLWDPREQRRTPHWEARGRGKARVLGSKGQAPARVCFLPELGNRGSPVREKMWVPWYGLIVIGKKMELLGRNKQKPRKPEPETKFPGLEDEETVRKARSGLSQERNVRLLHLVASVLHSSAGFVKESPKEAWAKPEVSRKTRVDVGSAGTPTGSRRPSGLKEAPRFPGVRTSREDMRSRGYKPGRNEERLSISGGKLRLNEEKRRSRGEKMGTGGEDVKGSGMGSTSEDKTERVVVKEILALR
ncbi:hypothetical protein D623_10030736 [Myotis brandtii]|uniref:Uncharacterized protein n=1 Tax=Myotis brandtii TaxID=109478 RepID=S7MQC5_MYOBR|nr:hypothetical protein D623_10030736 [Myotis brandtii]